MANASRKLSRGEKNLFLVTSFAIALLLGFGAWRSYVNAIPDVKIPTPKLPNPNAWDFYVKAGAAIVPANPPVDPAYDSQVVPRSQWNKRYPTARKRSWIRANTRAMSVLRQGFKYSCLVPPQRAEDQMHLGANTKFRELARMLAMESRIRQTDNDWPGAAHSALDIIHLGQDISRGGVLIDYLVGCSINAIGRAELWQVLPHLNALEAKSAAYRLEKLYNSRVPFADVLREEKYWGQGNLLETMRSGQLQMDDLNEEKPSLVDRWRTWKVPRRVVYENYTTYMDSLIANARKPYGTPVTPPVIPNDPYNEALAPVFERSRLNEARNDAGSALLLIALALHAYQQEHMEFPTTISQLAPEYLQKIPVDPYDAGKPLHYHLADKNGQKYLLYSIGPDGVDNLGRVIEDKSKTDKSRYQVFDEKGDFVAGINY
jgi:hypothetical protein